VGTEQRPPWGQFPGIRYTLEKWGVLPGGSSKSDVTNLGVKPSKYFVRTDNPVKAIEKDLRETRPELVVMATHGRSGLSRLFHPSICKDVIRKTKLPTLMIPYGSSGFVDLETGACCLQRVLVPVSPEVQPGLAVDLARRLVESLETQAVQIRIFYVGESDEMPVFDISDDEKAGWETVCRQGDVLAELTEELRSFVPQLLVMLGRGRDSVLDFLLPGKIEQVASLAACPLLVKSII
ncbi:MAG: universal stress protein, partial [Candidatus Eremiobacteraeota bacterium]|nr:universal stress protein [Candidatus Eremiobacteraeota bacterium]